MFGIAAGAADQAVGARNRDADLALGSPRAWGGAQIQSLDPPAAAAADNQPLDAFPRADQSPSPRPASRQDELLSNETTFTRWAHIARTGAIYRRPTTASAHVARLHGYTEDGFSEVYLLLRAHWNADGKEWIKLRIPMRPNGRVGWVPRQDLRRFQLTHAQIIVDRARLRMYVNDHGHRVWSAPVAVGKPSTPTPSGHFWIRERFKIDNPRSGYWPYAFGTSDYSTLSDWPGGGVVGIHGPYYQASAIPGRVSHGCIRLRTNDDAWLAGHVGLGTPIRII